MATDSVAISIFDFTTNEAFNGRMITILKVNQDFRVMLDDGNILCIPKVRGWLTDTETQRITIFDLYWRKFNVEVLGFVEK
jgi:hypothetical protein